MRRVAEIPRLEGATMGRQKVIQITCDRCTRVEHRPLSDLPPQQDGPMFEASFRGKKVKFDDLCSGCEEIVKNHWEQIANKLKKASPIRSK
jgi:hypothetical protein